MLAILSVVWAVPVGQNIGTYWRMYSSYNQYERKLFLINSSHCDYHGQISKSSGSFTISANGIIDGKDVTMSLKPYFHGETNCINVNDRLALEFKTGTSIDVLYNSAFEAGYLYGKTPSIVPFQKDFKEKTLETLIKTILMAYLPFLIFGAPYFLTVSFSLIKVVSFVISGKK